MKKAFNYLKKITPIMSIVSLVGCIILGVISINTKNQLDDLTRKQSDDMKSYAPYFTWEGRKVSLIEVLLDHNTRINNLYSSQYNVSQQLNRSNRFINDYNTGTMMDNY